MNITRKEILRAIRKEPLKAGEWIHNREVVKTDAEGTKYLDSVLDKKCKVCAVGAVLRAKGIDPDQMNDVAWSLLGRDNDVAEGGDEKEALKDKNYLLALSIKFEKLADRLGAGKRTREKLVEFVKENFPKNIRT